MKVNLDTLVVSFYSNISNNQAYVGPDGKPRLFRPDQNMKRLARSAARVALPVRLSSMTGTRNLILM